MTTYTWLDGASDPWTTLADWKVASAAAINVPGAGNTAQIGAGTVTVGSLITVGGLRMSGTTGAPSAIAGDAMVIATGAAVFDGIVVQSGGGTTLLNGTTTLIGGAAPGTLYLDGGRILQNGGTLLLSHGVINLGALPSGTPAGGGTLSNASAGTILIQESGTVVAGGGGITSVINTGLIVSQTSGKSVISTLFQNSGTLHVQSGTFTLASGGQSTGAGTKIDAGATLELSGGTFRMQTAIYAPDGMTLIDGAIADFTGVQLSSLNSTLSLSSGQLMLGSHTATIGTLKQTASTSAGSLLLTSATVNVVQQAVFSGTVVQAGKGVTILNGSATLAASSVSLTSLNLDQGRKLLNFGTLTIASGSIALGSNPLGTTAGGGTLINGALGVIDIGTSGTIVAAGVRAGIFTNSGTINVDVSGSAVLGTSVTNRGTIHVQRGTLGLAAGGVSLSRSITVDAGGVFGITGGTMTISNGALVLGGGLDISGGLVNLTHVRSAQIDEAVVLSGGTLWLGVRPGTFGSFHQSGTGTQAGTYSVLNGTALVTVNGNASFAGVAVEKGPGTTKLTGNSTVAAGAALYLDGGRSIQNNGTFVVAGGTIKMGAVPGGTAAGDAHFNNFGTLDIQTDGTCVAGVLGNVTLANYGVIEKSAGAGISTVSANVTNLGTVIVNRGTLALTATVAGAGVFQIGGTTVLDIGGIVNGGTMSFMGSNAVLQIDNAAGFAASIATIGSGNQIDITNFAWDSSTIANFTTATTGGGTLTVTNSAGSIYLGFSTNYSSYGFTLGSDGHSGLMIS